MVIMGTYGIRYKYLGPFGTKVPHLAVIFIAWLERQRIAKACNPKRPKRPRITNLGFRVTFGFRVWSLGFRG